ncbi:metallophosphoesterase [Limimaricola cinnabarinus]|uniref:metallophosphoesterase n=1 Tax=Limimaricola cinnabarinus TaxID=1125964 RepID=UPI0024909E49|nr:metallophosphoesterase [Limimaricola cinnabarinus]
MQPLDAIPDIHADPDRLARSLDAAEPGARIAFLGDFIDALPGQAAVSDRAVLERVRDLVETGRAVAVMGNHELNAILFHRLGIDGAALRRHSPRNRAQHRSFVADFGIMTPQALGWTDWFLTLPLWREEDGLRLVHACWSAPAIETVAARRPDGRLREADLPEIAARSTRFGRAVQLLVTGPEQRLPEGMGFHDSHGTLRRRVRLAWWRHGARSWRDAALSVPDPEELPRTALPARGDLTFYPKGVPPVLCGHYKMRGAPCIEARNVACLDYPDTPCIYRWRGEARLMEEHLQAV